MSRLASAMMHAVYFECSEALIREFAGQLISGNY